MKKESQLNKHNNKSLTIVFVLGIAMLLQTGCKDQTESTIQKNSLSSYLLLDSTSNFSEDPYKELIIWADTSMGEAALTSWIDSVKHANKDSTINVSRICGNCSGFLLKLTGPGAELFISGQTAKGGTGCTGPNCGPSGTLGPITYSINFKMDFSDSSIGSNQFEYPVVPDFEPQGNTVRVTVAVFDTGIDPKALKFNSFEKTSSDSSCLGPSANKGWNFVNHNPDWRDLSQTSHGTTVTNFITQQGDFAKLDQIQILPVKVFDANGRTDLFSVLCGIAYAANRGANIINASFGYYAPRPSSDIADPDSSDILFRNFVKHYLTRNNIIMVAAAGNATTYEDTAAAFQSISAIGKRSLDSVFFFPASFASYPDMKNVISVTTVSKTTRIVSPKQNHSPNVVDLGVNADVVLSTDMYGFFKPRLGSTTSSTAVGSSFAAPIITGIIASHYSLLSSDQISNKDNLIDFLIGISLVRRARDFERQINHRGTISARVNQ